MEAAAEAGNTNKILYNSSIIWGGSQGGQGTGLKNRLCEFDSPPPHQIRTQVYFSNCYNLIMKRYVLFSSPTPEIIDKIAPLLFPKEFRVSKILAYMPSNGANTELNEKYTPFWKELTNKFGVSKFNFIDNSNPGIIEKDKISESNILLITGGNTFSLLNNIRKNSLDNEIIKTSQKDDYVIAGFSAGAVILTPTINIVTREWSYGKDENYVGIDDFKGLGLIDFEVLPHYTEADKNLLEEYKKLQGTRLDR